MKKEYDFSKSIKNPYAKHLEKQVTLRLGTDVMTYFKNLADETGIPYQSLINLYLRDCVQTKKKLKWASWSVQTVVLLSVSGFISNFLHAV